MKKLLTLVLFVINISAIAQVSDVSVLDPFVNPDAVLDELLLPPPPTEGNVYLNDEWLSGSLVIYGSKVINNQLLRYDIKHKHLEIKTPEEIKVCPLSLLESFSWFDKELKDSAYFVNINHIPNQTEFYDNGILEVLYEEKASLYRLYYLEVQESTYVPSLDMGRRSNKILKKSDCLLLTSGKFYTLSKTMKNNKKAFGNEFVEVSEFTKKNKLKMKNETDLVGIVRHYNTLLDN
ncbi:MAG: hypothetical protein DRI71_08310 [Bacteroidetes bacterium]|nr:MAG: hypothetical protein DRI71_08310 [Bacteroidota bacterium]